MSLSLSTHHHSGLDLAKPVSASGAGASSCLSFSVSATLPRSSHGWLFLGTGVGPVAFVDHLLLTYRLTFLHIITYLKVLCLCIPSLYVFLLCWQPLPLDCEFPANRNCEYIFSVYLF